MAYMKNRKHRLPRVEQPPQHELTDDMVRAMMPGASDEVLELCEVALCPESGRSARACKDLLMKGTK